MNEMRTLMETVGKIDESYYSRLAAAVDDIALYNKRLPADELIELIRNELGDQAAEYMREKIASGEAIEEDEEEFRKDLQNPQWRERRSEENKRRQERLAKRDEDDLYMARVKTPKGTGTVYSINNLEPTDPSFPHPTVSVRLDSDAGGFGGGSQQYRFKLDDVEVLPDEIVEEDDEDDGFGPLLNDDEYEMVKREMAKRGHTPHSLGINKKGQIIAKDDLSVGGPEYTFDRYGNTLDIEYVGPDADIGSSELHPEADFDDWLTDNPFESLEEGVGRVVEVPPELRGNTELTGSATSEDAMKFINDLGPDDQVSHEVVDPETGELLDWPSKFDIHGQKRYTKRERGKTEWEKKQEILDKREVPALYFYGETRFGEAQDSAWEFLNDLRASDFYNVVWREVGGVDMDTGDEDAFQDYDTEYEVPVLIKRKDGKKLTSDDHDNMREIVKAVKFGSTMQNTGVQYVGQTDGGTTARFVPSFF